MKVVAIVGPTAVGKTALSLAIAEALNAEIISVDSRQIYRYMDVGTDKISIETRKKIIHHLIDVADPDENFTVADFVEHCKTCVPRIVARGRVPLFVGGTPFYYNALFGASITEGLPHDPAVRKKYENIAKEEGNAALHALLSDADPTTAARLHPNDAYRVSRALEIYELTNEKPSKIFEEQKKTESPFEVSYIGLNRPRPELFEKITERVKFQFHNGYPEEVEWLLKNGFDENLPSMRGFGYRELAAYIKGRINFDEALEGDIRSTKTFCRRQMTWFKKFSPITWYDSSKVGEKQLRTEITDFCLNFSHTT